MNRRMSSYRMLWALAAITFALPTSVPSIGQVVKEIDLRTCGNDGNLSCMQIRDISHEKSKELVVTVTDFLARRDGTIIFVRQRLLLSRRPDEKTVPEGGASFLSNPPPVVIVVTHFGSPQEYPDAGSQVLGGGDQWSDALRRKTLKALDDNRKFVDTQRVEIERSQTVIRDWTSASIGDNTAALSSVMTSLATLRETSEVRSEINFQQNFWSRPPDYLDPPKTELKGLAVQRHSQYLSNALLGHRYQDVVNEVRALRSSALVIPEVSTQLKTITRVDGTVDLSRAAPDAGMSPLGNRGIVTTNVAGRASSIMWEADEYEALWAQTGALSRLDPSDVLAYLVGVDCLREAAVAGGEGNLLRTTGFITASDGLLQGVRGFGEGMVQGLNSAAESVPELGSALLSYGKASLSEKIVMLVQLGINVHRIPEMIKLSVATSYDRWQSGGTYEKARIMGRAAIEVIITVATGEALEYIRAAGNVDEVAKLSRLRKNIAVSLGAMDEGGELAPTFNSAVASSVPFDIPSSSIGEIKNTIARDPERAAALVRVLETLRTANVADAEGTWGPLVATWGTREPEAALAVSSLISAGSVGLADRSAESLLGVADKYQKMVKVVSTLTPSTLDNVDVYRAIPRTMADGTMREEASAFSVSPKSINSIGRFKEKGELTLSSVIADQTSASSTAASRAAAFQTVIEEYGQYYKADDPFWLVKKSVSSDKILKLDDQVLAQLGITRSDIVKINTVPGAYTDTLLISRAARKAGIDAILAPSAADPGGTQVLHIFDPKIILP